VARRSLRKPAPRRSLRPRTSYPPPPADGHKVEATSAFPDLSAARSRVTAAADDRAVHALEDRTGALEDGADTDVERLTRSFFSVPPEASAYDEWEEGSPLPMTAGARRAMYATFAIVGTSVLLLGGYVAYQRVVMPVPVDLGAAATMPSATEVTPLAQAPVAHAPSLPSASPAPHPSAAEPAPGAAGGQAALPPPSGAMPEPEPEPAVAVPTEVEAVVTPTAPMAEAEPPPVPEVTPMAAAPSAPVTALLEEANALYARGQHKQALAAYEAVVEADPYAAPALSRIAYLRLNAGDDARAREYANRAVELDPTSSEGWIVLGAARAALRDRDGARAAYRQCAEVGQGAYLAECRKLAR
jgi:hypothetical protein